MSRKVIEMNVRGKQRRVYLETPVKNGKARATVYVSGADTKSGRTTVGGTYSVNRNGQRRFVANSANADLL